MSTICTCKHGHGSSRSVVRQIGNSVPLDTGRRIHVQVSRYSDSPSPVRDQNDYDTAGLTLASHFRNPGHAMFPTEGEGEEGAGGGMEWGDMASDDSGMETILDGEDEEEGAQTEQKHEALEKISALESELARLKAQIAVYALSEASNIPAAPPPPPPPMAPPLPPTASSTPAHPPQARVPLSMQGRRPGEFNATPAANPNLSHVLQDIGSVKLRSVPSIVRSPGGTPMRKKDQENREPASNDPAAVIAQALRRKFAHHVFQDSPDKGNLEQSSDASTSGFDSPAGKLFN